MVLVMVLEIIIVTVLLTVTVIVIVIVLVIAIVRVRVVQSNHIPLPKQKLSSTGHGSVSVWLTDLRRRFFISKHLSQHAAWAQWMKVSEQEGPWCWGARP